MNPVADFLAAMEAQGVHPAEPIAQALESEKLVRFRCEGDRAGRRNGWAILYTDGKPAGTFGNFRLGVRQNWCSGAPDTRTPAEKRAQWVEHERKAAERAAELLVEQERAAERAAGFWEAAGPASGDHPYLTGKGLDGEGLRQRGDILLAPMRDVSGRLWNLQHIAPDGRKVFLKGGRTAGLLCIIGEGGNRCCLGEGVGTMKAVRAATGYPVAASFSGENLERVARAMRARWPALDLIVCADDDAHLADHPRIRKNLGLAYATAAARAVGGRLAKPTQEAH